jgi:hypothetical protein
MVFRLTLDLAVIQAGLRCQCPLHIPALQQRYPKMTKCNRCCWLLLLFALIMPLLLVASDQIPQAAWRIGIGQPPANPGGHNPANGNIDNGYWQGAPVGGLGAGTFSRSYRGNFERWHVKAGVHKYQNVPVNQFAVFAQPEGGKPVAQVLSTGKPKAVRFRHGVGRTRWVAESMPRWTVGDLLRRDPHPLA